jgi:hypothetical protein
MGGCKDASVGHHQRGNDYFDNGEYDKAIFEFTKCLDKKPRVAGVHYSRGLAHGISNKSGISPAPSGSFRTIELTDSA